MLTTKTLAVRIVSPLVRCLIHISDENDTISTRALSLTRYRRNHDIMAEVFTHAAYCKVIFYGPNIASEQFSDPKNAPPPPAAFSIFNKAELEAQTVRVLDNQILPQTHFVRTGKIKGRNRSAACSRRGTENGPIGQGPRDGCEPSCLRGWRCINGKPW